MLAVPKGSHILLLSRTLGESLTGGHQTIEEKQVMGSRVAEEVDFIEELKLRRWAREHYVTNEQRQQSWHPVVLDEMARKDREGSAVEALYTSA